MYTRLCMCTVHVHWHAGITVLVMAVPEGLPLAVTLALAYSVKVYEYTRIHTVLYSTVHYCIVSSLPLLESTRTCKAPCACTVFILILVHIPISIPISKFAFACAPRSLRFVSDLFRFSFCFLSFRFFSFPCCYFGTLVFVFSLPFHC